MLQSEKIVRIFSKLAIMFVFTVLLGLCLPAFAHASTVSLTATSPVTISDGYYKLKSSLGSYYLDMAGASVSPGGNAQVYSGNNTAAQKWKFTRVGTTSYYVITNANSGLALDVVNGSSKSGTNVRQWECNESSAQQWKIYKSNVGGYMLINRASGKALDVAGGVAKNGVNVHIWDKNNLKPQSWKFTKISYTPPSVIVGNGYYTLRSSLGSYYLDMTGASKSAGGNAQVYSGNNSAAQKWLFTRIGTTSYYKITNANSGLALDVVNGSSKAGTNVHQWSVNGCYAQQWKIFKSYFGGYMLINRASGKYLDVAGGVAKNGVNVHVWNRNNQKPQSWVFTKTTYTPPKPSTTNNNSTSTKPSTGTNNSTNNKKIYPTGISITAPTNKLDRRNTTYRFSCTLYGTGITNSTVTWSSSNNKAAKVDAYGRVTAIANGKATITARTANGKTASANVTVEVTHVDKALAKKIFTAYNNFRASKGLKRVAWSDYMASQALTSAKKSVEPWKRGDKKAVHTVKYRVKNYSDIMMYANWKMAGTEAVKRWKGSTGHRKMMQCKTATKAGVAVYKEDGIWYYAIVYNFTGTNQNGN